MNILNMLKEYGGKWAVKETTKFSDAELAEIKSATIVPSQYGASVCMLMKNGNQKFMPLSQNSSASIGETVDLSTAKVLILKKEGQSDILRCEV